MSSQVLEFQGPSGPVEVSQSNPLPVAASGTTGFTPLQSPPATTNAGSDTALTWTTQVNHYRVQNNTSANLNIREDSASSPGSLLLVPGAIYREDKPVTTIHLFTAAAQNINGTVAANIVVEGWA